MVGPLINSDKLVLLKLDGSCGRIEKDLLAEKKKENELKIKKEREREGRTMLYCRREMTLF